MTATADSATCSRNGAILVSADGTGGWSLSTVVARVPSVDGTSWRTDLVLINPGAEPADVTLTYAPGGAEHPTAVSLPAGSTREWGDVVASLFGLTTDTSGALGIDSSRPITATVRTFNSDPAGDYGQFFPAVDGGSGLTASGPGVPPHLKGDAASRTNVGLLNVSGQAAEVRVTVFGPAGQQLGGPLTRTVPANGWGCRSTT